ncbi:MAG TPA: UDP-N-acetylmuramoyl-L-alanine--D-glutamate ligase [Candidatus Kapabacteria bacterium]|nr:UDP-N-acetylmuramoyl-L-alanine--D-glutamate ligase [Candidatus Kapabacteria bacterium]
MIAVRNKKFAVIGAARSGVAVARLLHEHNARVFVSDSKPLKTMKSAAAQLDELSIPYEFGKHTGKVQECDALVLSPGVPSTIPVVKLAAQNKKKIYSEIEIAYNYCKAPIVAITGSNGKTTTTSLIGDIFKRSGRKTFVAGNIGLAFSDIVNDTDEKSVVVLEVSSFQLEHIEEFRPKVSVLLNISPDHLDRYDSYEDYIQAKFRIAENQRGRDVFIYNYDDTVVRDFAETLSIKAMPFSREQEMKGGIYAKDGKVVVSVEKKEETLIQASEIGIRGAHNLSNAMAAVLAARAMDVDNKSICEGLKNFKGVEHRLEFVRELKGVKYVNDSKATNVDSVWYALQSFTEPIILIAGGKDKGASYAPLRPLMEKNVKAMVLIGEAAKKMEKELGDVVKCVHGDSMEDAVKQARAQASAGDVVLLSPACASFDMFDNYEHRGRVFKEIVMNLK